MEYIKLFWKHKLDNEPFIIYYEVDTDNERLALRSIDVFKNGSKHKINDIYYDAIEITSIPTVEEINFYISGEELYAVLVSKEEFEEIWNE